MFSLVAAIDFAKQTNRTIVVDWKDGVFSSKDKNAFTIFFELNDVDFCDFDEFVGSSANLSCYPHCYKGNLDKGLYDLFMAGSSNYLKKLPGISRLTGRLSRLSEFWMYSPADNFGKSVSSDWLAIKSLFSTKYMEFGHKLSATRKEDVVVFADYWPGVINETLFRHIIIKSELIAKYESIRLKLGITNETIGLHVRFSDKKPTKEFEKLIDYLNSHNTKELFLCTDSRHVENTFRDTFKNRLIVFRKFSPGNNDSKNMHHWSMRNNDYSKAELIYEESLIDLLLLASCKKILYQGNSSYSKLALIFNQRKSEAINWLQL